MYMLLLICWNIYVYICTIIYGVSLFPLLMLLSRVVQVGECVISSRHRCWCRSRCCCCCLVVCWYTPLSCWCCMLIYTSGVHCIMHKSGRAFALERLVVQSGRTHVLEHFVVQSGEGFARYFWYYMHVHCYIVVVVVFGELSMLLICRWC